ncbi:MAG: metallophosphoesterase [Myxococcota bacterium]
MKILAIGDIHSSNREIAFVATAALKEKPDIIFLVGDFGSTSGADISMNLLADIDAPKIFVPGNNDRYDIPTPMTFHNVDISERGLGKVFFLQHGIAVAGIGGAPRFLNLPYEWNDSEELRVKTDEFEKLLAAPRRIILCHAPPAGTSIAKTVIGTDAGAKRVKALIERVKPELFVCGHIHEARGVENLGDALLINCGNVRNNSFNIIPSLKHCAISHLIELGEAPGEISVSKLISGEKETKFEMINSRGVNI